MSRRDDIAAALTGDDPEARAHAIGEVGMLALGHPPVLAAMVAMTGDPTPLPDAVQPASDDPFAAFFGAEPQKRTFAEQATARIFAVGLPGHGPAMDALAQILRDNGDPAACATVARLFAETRWEDPEAAARNLIPALHARDVSLAPVIAGADAITLKILMDSALSPYRSRAVNELMNAPGSREPTAAAILEILEDLEDDRLAEALAILISWELCPAESLQSLEVNRPWVAKFTAKVDRAAEARAAGVVDIPESAVQRLGEI